MPRLVEACLDLTLVPPLSVASDLEGRIESVSTVRLFSSLASSLVNWMALLRAQNHLLASTTWLALRWYLTEDLP